MEGSVYNRETKEYIQKNDIKEITIGKNYFMLFYSDGIGHKYPTNKYSFQGFANPSLKKAGE